MSQEPEIAHKKNCLNVIKMGIEYQRFTKPLESIEINQSNDL